MHLHRCARVATRVSRNSVPDPFFVAGLRTRVGTVAGYVLIIAVGVMLMVFGIVIAGMMVLFNSL